MDAGADRRQEARARRSAARVLAGAVMATTAAGFALSVVFGAPLVSFLLAGLLLLWPLLLWVPNRFRRSAAHAWIRGPRP